MKTTFIYALADPVPGRIRYVGKSDNPKKRLRYHLVYTAAKQTHCGYWLKSLRESGGWPSLFILAEVPVSDWESAERHWIDKLRSEGEPLTNIRPGGECPPARPGQKRASCSDARREKMRKAHADGRYPAFSEEHRAKISAAKKGVPRPASVGQAVSKANRSRAASGATRRKISEAKQVLQATPEYKASQSERMKSWWAKRKAAKAHEAI